MTTSTRPEILTNCGSILRGSLDYRDGLAVVTVLVRVRGKGGSAVEWVPIAVTSERQFAFVEGNNAKTESRTLTFHRPPQAMPSLARWRYEDVERYLRGEAVNAADLFEQVFAIIEKYVELPSHGIAETVALWMTGTYLFPLFPAYPYLELNGPRGSGKSKLLALVGEFAFNGRVIVAPTEATTFRLIEDTRGTICFDEAENFNKDQRATLLQILNTGYRAGCTVPRCEEHDGQQVVREFEVYSPKAFASINGIDDTTATRCIRIPCLRTTDNTRGNLAVSQQCEPWAEVRHRQYCFALTYFKEIQELYQSAEVRPFSNRDNEKWSPLLALAGYFERNGCRGLVRSVTEFARHTLGQAVESGLPPDQERLLRVLHQLTRETPERKMTPKEICDEAKQLMPEEAALWPQSVGYSLRSLRFPKQRHTNRGEPYLIARSHVEDVAARYQLALGESTGNPSLPSPPEQTEPTNSNDNNN